MKKSGKRLSTKAIDNKAVSDIIASMAIEVRKREGESPANTLFNFTKRVKRSGILKEIRARKFHERATSRTKRRLSAIHREARKAEVDRMKKLGLLG